MTKVRMLHNPRCSKSRETLSLLTLKAVDVELVEYLKQPLSKKEISDLAKKLGLKPSEFVRKGEYSKLGISKGETEAAIEKQMAEYPILIERPIVINGGKAKIGRPPESVLEIL